MPVAGADSRLLTQRHQLVSPRISPRMTAQCLETPQRRLILTQLETHPELTNTTLELEQVLAGETAKLTLHAPMLMERRCPKSSQQPIRSSQHPKIS